MKIKLLPLSVALATILSPLTVSADDSLTFSGYARYGMKYSAMDTDSGSQFITAPGSIQNKGVGRLGNNGNGGEFQFTKAFEGDNGTEWQVAVMLDHWGDAIGLKKFYAKATNIFEAQPNLTVWAGRDFHQRPQTSLSDFYYMTHDGQGAGFTDLELDGVKLDFAAVAQTNDATGDSGNYAITSKLHGIDLAGFADLAILANYGFSSDTNTDGDAVDNPDLKAVQIAAIINAGENKIVLRYANNVDGDGGSVFNKDSGRDSFYAGLESHAHINDKFSVEYAAAYAGQTYSDDTEDKNTFSLIARPMYAWDDIHSTWLEAGYEFVDDGSSEDSAAYKITLSQNISINGMTGRPMLRFYVTAGQEDDHGDTTDKISVGGMFESWW
jgi:maltoporin